MLPVETIIAIADELAEAERSRSTIPRLTARYPDMTVEDSYAVQNEWRRRGVEAVVGPPIAVQRLCDS